MRLIAIQGNTPSEIGLILLTWIGKKAESVKTRQILKAPNLARRSIMKGKQCQEALNLAWRSIMKEKQCHIIYLRRIPI